MLRCEARPLPPALLLAAADRMVVNRGPQPVPDGWKCVKDWMRDRLAHDDGDDNQGQSESC